MANHDISGAMLTSRTDTWEKACRFMNSRPWGRIVPAKPLAVMLHIVGYGPRRVYEYQNSGRQFVRINNRRVWITEEQHGAIIRQHLEAEQC